MNALELQRILTQVEAGAPGELVRELDGTVYRRVFRPRERLILLGGGHVSQALCRMGALLDFSVTVADDRPAFANRERFPDAEAVICDSFENALEQLSPGPGDYVCVLTRGHRWDALCVRTLLRRPLPRYLGMMGSHRRVKDFRQVLAEEGVVPEKLEALHAPIGISIGAVTPMEVAASICAELVQVRRQTGGTKALTVQTADLPVLRFLAPGDRALALVLETTGSTPAKPGTVMGVDRLGNTAGTVGGGCAEAGVIARARRLIGTGRAERFTVDMTNEVAEELGMVCGGTVTLLLEDVTPA